MQIQVTHAQNLQSSVGQLENARQQQDIALHEAQNQLVAFTSKKAQTDPAVLAEMEVLKKSKSKMEDESKILSKKKEALEKELADAKKKLDDSEKERASQAKAVKKGGSEKAEMEAKMSDLSSRLSKAEKESARLAEENERLSEQLASNVERPVAEGQESNSKQNGMENGVSNKNNARVEGQEETQALQKQYQVLVQEKDNM